LALMVDVVFRDGRSFSLIHQLHLNRVVLNTIREHVHAIRTRTVNVDDFVMKLFEPNVDQFRFLGYLYNTICDLYCIVFHELGLVGHPKEIAIYRSSDLELLLSDVHNWWLLHHLGHPFYLPDMTPLRSFCAGPCPPTCFFLTTFNNGRGSYTGEILLGWIDDVVPTFN